MTGTLASRTHQTLWSILMVWFYAVGLSVAWLSLPVLAVVGLTAGSALMGTTFAGAWTVFRPVTCSQMTAVGIRTAAFFTAGTGIGIWPGGPWLLGFVGVPLVSPGVWRLLLRRFRARTASRTVEVEENRPARLAPPLTGDLASVSLEVPDHLDRAHFCQLWRSTFVTLQRAADAESRLRTVEIRELCLNELEKHDAAAFEAWLSSGPRAASDPSRYLGRSARAMPAPDHLRQNQHRSREAGRS